MAKRSCKWTEDSEGNWETGCVNIFVFIEGIPSDNDMKFCCYCGLPLKEIKYVEEYNDDEI